ncbi:helix-turn-helix domain-containing protein [Nocardiopsis sp. CNT-189]|uniref:helix-turn-helix domain-containing protein n=1 Tax=Nocardiopsis oceanisediminis TaxID=2816862 RepID=UPI003B2FF20E
MEAPTVYRADEAAEVLKCKPSWLKKQAARRAIPVRLIGGSYAWTPEDLEAIVAQRLRPPAAAPRPAAAARPRRPAAATAAAPRAPVRPLRARRA